MQRPDKRVRSSSPSANNSVDNRQEKRLRSADGSHSIEEVTAASTLTQLSDTSGSIRGVMRTLSQLSFQDDEDNAAEGNSKIIYISNKLVNQVIFQLLLQILITINVHVCLLR